MKFDMNRAWGDAMSMVKNNMDVLGIVAAVFFFLPTLANSVLAPGTELEAAAADPSQLQAAFMAYFTENWWIFLLSSLVSLVGTMAVFALFGRSPKPTVGEAISAGLAGFLPYLGATLILGFAFGLAALLVGVLAGATGSAAVGVILGFVLVVALIIVGVRMVLVGPVIAIEGVSNPITALQRSWELVKGNTRRVFLFLLLIIIALVVVSMVLGLIFAAVGSLAGPTASVWVEGFLGGILSAVLSVMLLAIYTAIHRQLAGDVSASDIDTFS